MLSTKLRPSCCCKSSTRRWPPECTGRDGEKAVRQFVSKDPCVHARTGILIAAGAHTKDSHRTPSRKRNGAGSECTFGTFANERGPATWSRPQPRRCRMARTFLHRRHRRSFLHPLPTFSHRLSSPTSSQSHAPTSAALLPSRALHELFLDMVFILSTGAGCSRPRVIESVTKR